ncbi:hypothetical protein L7Q77_33820, partial [Pseudomonas aeruginosa]
GINGCSFWKNSGVTSIGKVPPPPAILTQKLVILIAFGLAFLIIGIILKPITDPIMRKVAERAEKSEVME